MFTIIMPECVSEHKMDLFRGEERRDNNLVSRVDGVYLVSNGESRCDAGSRVRDADSAAVAAESQELAACRMPGDCSHLVRQALHEHKKHSDSLHDCCKPEPSHPERQRKRAPDRYGAWRELASGTRRGPTLTMHQQCAAPASGWH